MECDYFTAKGFKRGRPYQEEAQLYPLTTEAKVFFGKLFFAVAPFQNNSLLLADPTLSGNIYTKPHWC
jgi:hypothetical protein